MEKESLYIEKEGKINLINKDTSEILPPPYQE